MFWKILSGLLTALSALPKVIDSIKALIESIRAWARERQRSEDSKNFDEAAKKAIETGDTCELEKIFNPDKVCTPPAPTQSATDGSQVQQPPSEG